MQHWIAKRNTRVVLAATAGLMAGVLLALVVVLWLSGGANSAAALPGVKAKASTVVLRPGAGVPPGELGFLAVTGSGSLIVSNRERRSVLTFDPSGRLISEWGPRLGPDVTIVEPAGVAAVGERVFVVDRGQPRLIGISPEGRAQTVIPLDLFSPYGLNGLASDQAGNLYVADTGRNRILMLSQAGQLVKEIGRPGRDLGQFTQPMAMAFGPDGSLFVADWENARLQRFDRTLTATDVWSPGFAPFSVAVDDLGRVYAPDVDRRRVLAFGPRGVQLGEIGGPGSVPIDLAGPNQVAVVPGGHGLYVLGRNGVVRLDLEDTAPPSQVVIGELVEPTTLGAIGFLAVVAALVFDRRRRGRRPRTVEGAESGGLVRRALWGPAGLNTEDGAQRHEQEPGADHHRLILGQSHHKQDPGEEHN